MDYSLLIPALIAGIFFWIAETRKGSLKITKPHYSQTFITEVPASQTFKSIMEFATNNGYRIDDFDEHQLAVILNERMTLTSSGSLYPIYVRQYATRTEVEVGVTSKFGKALLISPVNKKFVTLRLERMVNAIKGAVFAQNKER
jgi:hypothetical protein